MRLYDRGLAEYQIGYPRAEMLLLEAVDAAKKVKATPTALSYSGLGTFAGDGAISGGRAGIPQGISV